jgi:mannosyl-glycoprotein endo-beta-N-acetylglucosaminidase
VDKRLIGKKLCATQTANERRKLFVCHDMKNGYLEDRCARARARRHARRFADGHSLAPDAPPPFYLTHWPYIDVFNYFSHHLVTIPPRAWIDAAHTNGTKVIGTGGCVY